MSNAQAMEYVLNVKQVINGKKIDVYVLQFQIVLLVLPHLFAINVSQDIKSIK